LEEKRIKLYEVNVSFSLSPETKAKIVDDEEEGFTHPDQIPEVDGTFHIGAENLIDATMIAQEYATEEFPDGFHILSISEMQEIFLANWPVEDDPLDWDESTPPEELMTFSCTCGTDITLRNNKWQYYECPDCEKIIDRNHIVENKGKFLFVDIE
jgi:predicted RNA-binding Zn-ribbon protein involved in translation (DUF1610 family)